MTLHFASVIFVCVRSVGCVHPSYAEARCVLIMLVSLDATLRVNKKALCQKKELIYYIGCRFSAKKIKSKR